MEISVAWRREQWVETREPGWQISINNLCGFREIIFQPVLHLYPNMAAAITYLTIWGDG